jgi:DUF1680 family protein
MENGVDIMLKQITDFPLSSDVQFVIVNVCLYLSLMLLSNSQASKDLVPFTLSVRLPEWLVNKTIKVQINDEMSQIIFVNETTWLNIWRNWALGISSSVISNFELIYR